jgi:hypothetical protein
MYYAPHLRRVKIWTETALPGAQSGVMPQLFGITRITRNGIIASINGNARVVIVLRSGDDGFLPNLLKDVPAPAARIDRRCRRGKGELRNIPVV